MITGSETQVTTARVGVRRRTVPGAVTRSVTVTRTRRVGGASHRAGRAGPGLRSRGHLRCRGLLTLSVLFSLLACRLFSRLLTCGLLLSLLACRLSRGGISSLTVGADLLNRTRRIHNAGTARGLVALNALRGGLQNLLRLRVGQLRVDAFMSATIPATCGAAIEVPWYSA